MSLIESAVCLLSGQPRKRARAGLKCPNCGPAPPWANGGPASKQPTANERPSKSFGQSWSGKWVSELSEISHATFQVLINGTLGAPKGS